MNTIERLDALKNFAHEIGFLFYGANGYKENYVSDMYFMIKRFFTNEVEMLEHYENKKYCAAISEWKRLVNLIRRSKVTIETLQGDMKFDILYMRGKFPRI